MILVIKNEAITTRSLRDMFMFENWQTGQLWCKHEIFFYVKIVKQTYGKITIISHHQYCQKWLGKHLQTVRLWYWYFTLAMEKLLDYDPTNSLKDWGLLLVSRLFFKFLHCKEHGS